MLENINSTTDDINVSQDFAIVKCTKFEHEFEVIQDFRSVWMPVKPIADFYKRDEETIREHINNIFKEKNLDEKATTWEFQVVRIEGGREVKRNVKHYNFQVIYEIGMRVRSDKGKQLQNWVHSLGLNQIQQSELTLLQSRIHQLETSNYELKDVVMQMVRTYRIDEDDKQYLQNVAKSRIIELFDKPYTDIPRQHYKIAITALWRDFKEQFYISKYSMLPKEQFDNAFKLIKNWDNIPKNRF